MAGLTYKDSGVDIGTKSNFTNNIYKQLRSTFSPRVIENPGGFGGLFSLNYSSKLFAKKYKHPVLVASTDGVGTKLKIAFMMDKHDTIGIDLVAMSVNDLLVLGAEPLFFLDYMASGKIIPETLNEVIQGIAAGCCEAGCALLGGETPEMPDFYNENEYDLAGFAVGVVEKSKIINGKNIEPGDVVIGLSSSGIHSNGFSLVRKAIFEKAKLNIDSRVKSLNGTIGEELLRPTKIYVKTVRSLLRRYKLKKVIKGMAHITGGGLIDNIPRVLPPGCSVQINKGSWPVLEIFNVVQKKGNIKESEMYHVFNMGIGMVLIVSKHFASSIIDKLGRMKEEAFIIGKVIKGNGSVKIA